MGAGSRQSKTRPGIEAQRQGILKAAVSLFGESGSAAVSVSAICARADVSRDTFYRCYDNKEQLIDFLYGKSVSDTMLQVTDDPGADFGSQAWLAQTVDQLVDDILAEHEVARFLFLESADPSTHAYKVIHSAFNRVASSMQRWCQTRYGEAPSRECFTGLLSAAQWLVHEAIVGGMKPLQVKRSKRAIEELFLATFRGLEPKA